MFTFFRRAVRAGKTTRRAIAHAVPCLEVLEGRTLPASFQALDVLPGATVGVAYGVSADGSAVVGFDNYGTTGRAQAFRWTQATGAVGLGDLPGGRVSAAFGVSADGSVVVGYDTYIPPAIGYEAFRWTQATGMVRLGDLPGGLPYVDSHAYAVSADGSVVVGQGNSTLGFEAFRWTQADGNMTPLGGLPGGSFKSLYSFYSDARGVSADGSVVVGGATIGAGGWAFRWTQATGQMLPLDDPTGTFSSSGANAVSADGTVVVGAGNTTTGQEAFRWTQATGMVGLGEPPDGIFSEATAVSADGSVVVGDSIDTNTFNQKAFYWDANNGMRDLRDMLVNKYDLGAVLAGWTLTRAVGVSADGLVVVGDGVNPSGQNAGWVARLDLPPDITPTSMTWNTAQGGVDFGYTVSGATLPKDTTVSLYWSSSDKFADRIGGPIPGSPQTVPAGTPVGTYGPFHVDAAILGSSPPGASHLLAVTDPNNVLGTFDETTNVEAIAYDPTITVIAKYDGDPSPSGMGRYFSGTDALKDNYYTVMVSDSLDALRPTVVVTVGSQTLGASLSSTDADTFVTAAFDPGSLPAGEVPLRGAALIQDKDVADFSSTLLVEPLPDWAEGLNDLEVTFDPNGDGPGGGGAYTFDGFLPDLALSGTVFTVPGDVPFIGGKALRCDAAFELDTVAPLAVSSTPVLEAGLQVNLALGDSISLPVLNVGPSVGLNDGESTFTVTLGSTLDPVTLTQPDGFALTLAYDTAVPTPLNATLFDASTLVFPFGVPVALELQVKAALDVTLHAHAQVAFDQVHGLQFLPAGSYLGVGLEGSLAATGRVGWFAPAWVQRILNVRSGGLFNLSLEDTATLSVSLDAEDHFGGPVLAWQPTGLLFKGSAKFSEKLDLLFQLGDRTLIDLVIADLTTKSPEYTWAVP